MKKTCLVVAAPISLLMFLAGTIQVAAAEQKIPCKSVPRLAHDTFKASFPRAVVTKCAKETKGGKVSYEFFSDEGKIHRDVIVDADGKLVVSEEIVTYSTVPEPVKQAVEQRYPRGKVTLAEKLTRGDAVQYELRIKHRGKELEALFDPEGKEVDQ